MGYVDGGMNRLAGRWRTQLRRVLVARNSIRPAGLVYMRRGEDTGREFGWTSSRVTGFLGMMRVRMLMEAHGAYKTMVEGGGPAMLIRRHRR